MNNPQFEANATGKYFKSIKKNWGVIRHAYLVHADKMAVILLDITEGMVYVYPYKDFKAQLSEQGQASLAKQYNEGLKKNQFVIFVRDNREKKLLSYSMNCPTVSESFLFDHLELVPVISNMDLCLTPSHEIGTTRQQDRIRQYGGGRKLVEVKSPNIITALERMLADEVAGNPMTEQKWIRSSLSHLSLRLKEEGHKASTGTVARLLRKMGFSMKANQRKQGRLGCPERDEQYTWIRC